MGIIAGQGHCPSIGFIRVLSMEIGGLDRDAAKGCIHGNADKKRRCPAWEAPRTWEGEKQRWYTVYPNYPRSNFPISTSGSHLQSTDSRSKK